MPVGKQQSKFLGGQSVAEMKALPFVTLKCPEERELPVRILLDASESMTFGEPRKFDFARQVAAAIGYVALCGFDRVTVVPFPNEGANVATAGALTLKKASVMSLVRSISERCTQSLKSCRWLDSRESADAA